MTRAEVKAALDTAIRETAAILGAEKVELNPTESPLQVIPNFDSVVSVEVTTSVLKAIGVDAPEANPFLKEGKRVPFADVLLGFYELAQC